MESAKHIIQVGEERVELLFTPFVGSEAARRGITLSIEDKDDPGQVLELLSKLVYLSALNWDTLSRFDNPDRPDFTLKYIDFHVWAWQHQEELMSFSNRMINNIFAIKGAGAAEQEGVKKK